MERRLAAILSADVVGYSRLMGEDEARTLAALKAHRQGLIVPKEAQYHGRTIKLMGDGVLMEFGSVVDAVGFAVEIQLAMQERNADVPEDQQIVYRIGINVGDIIVEDDDIYGDGVNVAARLEGLAEPGGICVRRNVRNQVRDKLDLAFEDLGEVEVKNIARPVRAFRIILDEKAVALVTPISEVPSRVSPLSKWQIAAVLAVGIVAVSGLVWWQPWTPRIDQASVQRMALPLPDKPSIAVLPFANLGGDPDQEYFADGLTDDLITDLSKISGLFVIARNSVFTYKGQAVKVQQVAEDLGVRYVLEGSVRQSGSKIRINAQLIDAITGHHLWAERYDRDQEDLFAMQEEVMGKIVSALEIQLTDKEERQLASIPTSDLEAYDHYLRAEQSAYSADVALVTQAIEHYQRAITLDEDFAQAYAGLARTFADVLLYDIGNVVIGPVARDAAFRAASRAAELNPELPRPLLVLGIVQMVDGEYANAVGSARKGVALAPNNAEAHINLALVLAAAGKLEDAMKEIETALRLNPIPPPGFLVIAGIMYYLDRNYQDAAAFLEEVRKTIPKSIMAIEFLAMAYAQTGRGDEARKLIEIVLYEYDAGYSLSAAEVFYSHFQRQIDLTHILDGLQKAGLPRWPLEMEERPEGRLNKIDIEKITRGQTWHGQFLQREPFYLSFESNGSFALRTQDTIRVGFAQTRADELCLKSPSHFLGRWICGPIYQNSMASDKDYDSYVYVAGGWHFEFGLYD